MPPYHPLSIHTNFSWINAEAIQQKKQKTIKEVNVSHVTTTTIITRSFPLTLSVPPNVIPSHHSLHSSHCTNNTTTTYIHLSCKHLRLKAIAWIQDERMYEQDERSNEQIQLHEIVIWTTHTRTNTKSYIWAHTHTAK